MTIREEFYITQHGKRFVLYAGLLDEFHQRYAGEKGIATELLQIPIAENGNLAIVKATAVARQDDMSYTFEGIGDASPENVARAIVPHIIRMAETRAKARALRDAINIGVTALEELGGKQAPPDEPNNSAAEATTASQPANPATTNPPIKATKANVEILSVLADALFGDKVPSLHGNQWLEREIGHPLSELSAEKAAHMITRYTAEYDHQNQAAIEPHGRARGQHA